MRRNRIKLLVQIPVVVGLHFIVSFTQAYVIEQLEGSGQRSWDYNILSQEDVETIWLRKQEALIRRERMKKYSSSHRVTVSDFGILGYATFG